VPHSCGFIHKIFPFEASSGLVSSHVPPDQIFIITSSLSLMIFNTRKGDVLLRKNTTTVNFMTIRSARFDSFAVPQARERSYSCREYTNYLTSYSSTVLWAQRWLLPKLLACLVLLLATTRMQSTKMAEHCFFKSRRKKAQRETLSRHVTDREIGVIEAFCVSHQSTPKAPIVLYTR